MNAIHFQTQPISGRLLLPPVDKRYASDLLNQQMWCWGADIRRPEGNLLDAYGFTKHRPPQGSGLKPCYSIAAHDGLTIGLWGFGMYFTEGCGRGLFLKRFDFSPRMVAHADMRFDVWVARDLPELTPLRSSDDQHIASRLVCAALQWIAAYETWVLELAGPDYRTATTDAWREVNKRIAVAGPEMAEAWQKLARRCAPVQPASERLDTKQHA